MENVKVLVVDDEKNILESVKMVLNYEKYNVQVAKDGIEAIDIFKKFLPDIVLLDVKMPGLDGLKVLKSFKTVNPIAEVIMISGHSGIEEAVEASRLGAFDFLEKPIARDKLVLTVRNAAEKISLLKENFNLRNLTAKKYELVGQSAVMKALQETIRRVARSDSTVLISGDSGTGKELIARLIHQKSVRSQSRFVQVNCAAIPDELIESELFGHEKGSFTGAYEKKIGKFESAHRGSIFLDEIGDLSIKAQAKVLRVLEEGEVQPVGSPEIKKVNVRVIAATNKNLDEEIKKGNFREDLYFRLHVVPIHSPSLRDRKEDIPLLIDHFIAFFSEENNYRKKSFSAAALTLLLDYQWKGNVRELRNLVERMLIMCRTDQISSRDLPDYINLRSETGQLSLLQIGNWKEFKARSEKMFLEQKLKEFGYNVAKTAREIALPRSNLYQKIESLGIMSGHQQDADEESPLP
ncbi:MAG: sigma-54 dependent transcriptional regulator [Candidatus Aminicenantes bacterium]|nr:sigma-54 dependent transcriptional regulator [Acidobacteriota bacterium]MCG2810528.1 sigma-54 dependent transcriptional regulator [Candidatus Aminicenantes bacterium]